MSNKLLRFAILIGLFATPFIPFIISSSLFFPFITGKAFAFRIIVEIIFACYLVLAFRDESYRPKFSWILGSIFVFLLVIGVADIFSANPFKSFWSNYERMEGFISLLHFGAFFLVMSSVLNTQKLWNRLLATSVGASVIMSIYSFLQLAGKITINQGGVRVDGTLGNASYLGIYMVFHIFFAALLFLKSKKVWQKVLLSVIALTDLVVLYYTATRGAILGLLGGAFVSFVFIILKSERGSKIKKFAIAGFIGLVAFVGLFFAMKDISFVKNSPVLGRFASLSFSEIKTQGRYYIWPMAIKGFIEKPILGWGQESFNFVFNKYYNPEMYNQESWFDRAHNTFLDWLVAGGLLGLLSYLAIIFSLLFCVLKIKDDYFKKEEKAIVLGILAAYLFNNLFVFDQISSYILFFTLLAYIHTFSEETRCSWWQKISAKLKNIIESEQWQPVLESLIVIMLAAVLYFGDFIPWQQNKNLMKVLVSDNQNQTGSIDDYTKLFSKYNMGFAESLEHVSQISINILSNKNASNEFKQQIFDVVNGAYVTQLTRVSDDARYRLFYGSFLFKFGLYDQSLEQLALASKLSPKKQSIYFEIVNSDLDAGKTNEALAAAKTAYELEPSYDDAAITYGLVAAIAGDDALSEKILSGIEESKLIFDDRYISVLLSLKQYQKIIEVAQKRVELQPDNLQNHITLTAAFLQAGRRSEAIQTLQELIKVSPSFKEQGEYYIKEIQAGRNP